MQLVAARDTRPRLASVATVSDAIDTYWNEYAPPQPAAWQDVLDPLDALLTVQFLDLHSGRPTLVDATATSVTGVVSAAVLDCARLRRVVATVDPASIDLASALTQYAADRDGPTPDLKFLTAAAAPRELAGRTHGAVTVDARSLAPDALVEEVRRWLGADGTVTVLVHGLGRADECPRLAAVVGAFGASESDRVWLLREQADALATSKLAVVARKSHPYAGDLIRRLAGLYTNNVDFLDLLWKQNLDAMQASDVNHTSVATHPGSAFLLKEYNDALYRAEEAHKHIAALREEEAMLRARATEYWDRAAELWKEGEALRVELAGRDAELHRIHNTLAFRTGARLSRLRSRLAPERSLRHRLYVKGLGSVRMCVRVAKVVLGRGR